MKQLYFQNGRFRVMLVGAPHAAQTDGSPQAEAIRRDYLALQYAALARERPDLVVLMGDNAEGETDDDVRRTLRSITKPYVDAGVPFTFILGNHDLPYTKASLNELYALYRELPGILLPNDVSACGDFDLPVRCTETEKPLLELLFLYSGSSDETRLHSYYDTVRPAQNDWIKNRTAQRCAEKGGRVPAALFQHIPLPEEYALLHRRSILCMFGDGVKEQNERRGSFYTKKKGVTGYLGEAPCAPSENSGEFQALKETGCVFAAFFGHDHLNDFVGAYDGIIMGQCKTASFNVYGDGLRQGVRIVDFWANAPFTLETHMCTYRELLGNNCASLHGSIAVLHDKTSMKLRQAAGLAAAAGVLGASALLIRRKVNKYGGGSFGKRT